MLKAGIDRHKSWSAQIALQRIILIWPIKQAAFIIDNNKRDSYLRVSTVQIE